MAKRENKAKAKAKIKIKDTQMSIPTSLLSINDNKPKQNIFICLLEHSDNCRCTIRKGKDAKLKFIIIDKSANSK